MHMTDTPNQPCQVPAASGVADVPFELVTVALAGNYPGAARLFHAESPQRAVVYLHGIQSHGGWFLRSCDYLRRQGMMVLLPERRGSGLNRQDRGHCDSAGQLLEDVGRCVAWLRERSGHDQIDLVAVSWGGKLGVIYAAEHPEEVRSLTLVAPGLCAAIDISLGEKLAIGAHGLVSPKRLHEIPLNDPTLFTQTPEMLDFLRNDPLKLTHATASFFLTSRKLDQLIRRHRVKLSVPTNLFLAGQDRIIDNAATIALVKPATTKTYPHAHHTLEFEPDTQPFFNDLSSEIHR